MVRNYVKKSKIQYDDKGVQHDLQFINIGVSTQVELGPSIVKYM